jgi:DDE family transposase
VSLGYRLLLEQLDGHYDAVTVREPKRRHGREERRMLWTLADPVLLRDLGSQGAVGAPWPHVQQLYRLERHRTVSRRGRVQTSVDVTYGITSLPPARADARRLLQLTRGHWGIENRGHWVRDVTFDEDRSQVRTGGAPQLLAAARNLAIALLRRLGYANLAAARRRFAARPAQAVSALLSVGS